MNQVLRLQRLEVAGQPEGTAIVSSASNAMTCSNGC